jgi:hypothetical protein
MLNFKNNFNMNSKRKLALVITLAVLAIANTSFATIRRVNNNTGVTGSIYATLTAAYTAAVAGDTLLIEGSNTSYGDLTLTKKLTIFGPGYHLNQNTQTQASLLTVTLGAITFNAGSENSLISGCKINNIVINANDITISRNFIKNSTATSASIQLTGNTTNTVIQQNIVWGLITNTAGRNAEVVIRNNLLGRIVFTSDMNKVHIINNTIPYYYAYNTNSGAGAYAPGINVYNATIQNNIITHYDAGYWGRYGNIEFGTDGQNNTVSYNVLTQADPGSGLGGLSNYFSVGIGAELENTENTDIDKTYKVKSGGFADEGGADGVECGMFGGPYKYVLSGMPPIPHIYMIDADPAGTTSLKVKISVKSQN